MISKTGPGSWSKLPVSCKKRGAAQSQLQDVHPTLTWTSLTEMFLLTTRRESSLVTDTSPGDRKVLQCSNAVTRHDWICKAQTVAQLRYVLVIRTLWAFLREANFSVCEAKCLGLKGNKMLLSLAPILMQTIFALNKNFKCFWQIFFFLMLTKEYVFVLRNFLLLHNPKRKTT